jgi:hypothetical protein
VPDIFAPLPDVTVHVVEAPWIGFEAVDRHGRFPKFAFASSPFINGPAFTLATFGPAIIPTEGELRRGNQVDDERQRSDAMNRAFRQACARLELTGSTPVIELVAIRVVELARTGDFDPDRLTEATVSTFEG